MQVNDYSTSNIVDYSIEALLKKGGKVTGCIGFPSDPKTYTNTCKFCANFGNHVDGSRGCLRPYCGTDCYVWVTMPNGEIIGACGNFESIN